MQAAGHTVIAATLTGLGERAHLLTREVGLETHVGDIAGLLHFRDLRDVVLVGHSYGGTVITQVAERMPERLSRLVYLDGSVPADGQSNNDVVGRDMAAELKSSAERGGDGWRVPPAAYVAERMTGDLRTWVAARLTPHPWRCFEEPVRLASRQAAGLPRAFVRTTESALYGGLIERARHAGWPTRELGGGHYAMLTEPQPVAAVLLGLAR